MHKLPDVGKPVVRYVLRDIFKNAIKSSVVQLIISILAVCMAVFQPLEECISLWISSLLFIGVLLWGTVDFLKKYYMLPIMIIQERSFSNGIVEFARWKVPGAKVGSGLYDVARIVMPCFFSSFKGLRSSNSVIKEWISYVMRDIVLFISLFVIYILIVHCFFKPLILEKYAEITTLQIYLFPIKQFFLI